ncbi:MAG: M48 family metalloprotease [Nitrospinota bacterium]|nr:M48 family metalloprotease [Nitrospinota bacterium]
MRGNRLKLAAAAVAILLGWLTPTNAQNLGDLLGLGRGGSDNQKGSGQSFPLEDIIKAGAKTARGTRALSAEEEIAIGRAVAQEIFMRLGPRVEDPGVNGYVTMVGLAAAKGAIAYKAPYKFTVIHSAQINAFAAPGGYIFITTGLLSALRSEAELAGVLAHEVAHVAHLHMVQAIQRSNRAQGALELSSTLLGQDPKMLAQLAGFVTDTLFTNGLDQRFEFEADSVGVTIAAAAGYDARGLRDFLNTLASQEDKADSVFFSTHPSIRQRVGLLERNNLPRHGPGQWLKERYTARVR